MYECSCNSLTTIAFKNAVLATLPEIAAADNLLDAVGIVYRHARDHNPDIMPSIPSCTTCFDYVAQGHIQAAGFFKDETLPDLRTREGFRERQAQCFKPANTSFFPAPATAPRLAAAE